MCIQICKIIKKGIVIYENNKKIYIICYDYYCIDILYTNIYDVKAKKTGK